jgi:hypothetical protein
MAEARPHQNRALAELPACRPSRPQAGRGLSAAINRTPNALSWTEAGDLFYGRLETSLIKKAMRVATTHNGCECCGKQAWCGTSIPPGGAPIFAVPMLPFLFSRGKVVLRRASCFVRAHIRTRYMESGTLILTARAALFWRICGEVFRPQDCLGAASADNPIVKRDAFVEYF